MVRLRGDIPVGLGMGSSTSDVIAAVRAVADAHGVQALRRETVARLAVRAERASDPLMLDGRPLLFAQREGRVLEILGAALPPLVVVGCTLGGGRPVDTLALQAGATYDDGEMSAGVLPLAGTCCGGRSCTPGTPRCSGMSPPRVRAGGLNGTSRTPSSGRAGSRSPGGHGAVGLQIAHSGCVAGLLFDPAKPRTAPPAAAVYGSTLRYEGIPVSRTFTTHSVGSASEEFPPWTQHIAEAIGQARTSYASTTASSACALKP